MRLEVITSQQVRHAAARQPDRLAQESGRPAAAPRRRRRHRQLDHALDGRRRYGVIGASRLRPRREARHSVLEKASPDP